MHWIARRAFPYAPGLTPLTGQYSRAGEIWACYRRDLPQFSFVTDEDKSDEFTYCVRVKELEPVAKVIFYAARLVKLLRELPVPPPP